MNDISRRDAFALSCIDDHEVLDTVGRHKVYSVMDAASAFWSVQLHPDDTDKPAFSSRKWGLLRFTRMPFGLKTDTATYSRALTHVLRELLWKQATSYVDDVCVMGDGHETQMDALKNVLTRFSVNGVTLKLKKCLFGMSKIAYVGHVVT